MPLILRLPVAADEARVRELNALCSTERFDFLAGVGVLGAGPGSSTRALRGNRSNVDWADFLGSVMCFHGGVGLPEGWLPADFLLAEVRGEGDGRGGGPVVVGRASVRYGLTEDLLNHGGHIGYAVAPEFRCRGYATEILRQALVLLACRGVRRALLVCDDDNAGSARVIEANGGLLEDRRRCPGDGTLKRRYWIPLGWEAASRSPPGRGVLMDAAGRDAHNALPVVPPLIDPRLPLASVHGFIPLIPWAYPGVPF